MNIEIRTHSIEVSDLVRSHVERRLGFALARFGDRTDRVIVRFSDVNGPHRGGVDKRCQIEVGLRPAANVRVEDTDVDWITSVDRAAERASRAVARLIVCTRFGRMAAR